MEVDVSKDVAGDKIKLWSVGLGWMRFNIGWEDEEEKDNS